MRGTIYSDKEKGAALALVDFLDGNVRLAARRMDIPHTTLDEWVKGRHVSSNAQDIRTDQKIDWAVRLEEMMAKLAKGLEDEDKISRARLSENSTAFGTVFDKRQLLKGDPTNITQNMTLTEEQKQRLEALRSRLEVQQTEDDKMVM